LLLAQLFENWREGIYLLFWGLFIAGCWLYTVDPIHACSVTVARIHDWSEEQPVTAPQISYDSQALSLDKPRYVFLVPKFFGFCRLC
jgi:hypothetical protein